MTESWDRWLAPLVVTIGTISLALLDLVDHAMSEWWLRHPFLTATVTGILVLLITVLVADEVVRRRQLRDRATAIAAQAAILGGQAVRASRSVIDALGDAEQRDPAVDELRTYMTMLLIAAPVLIEAAISRAFLEDAQRLGGVLARVIGRDGMNGDPADGERRIREAGDRVRSSAQPLLDLLDRPQRAAIADATDDD